LVDGQDKAESLTLKHTPIHFVEVFIKNNTSKSVYIDRYTTHTIDEPDPLFVIPKGEIRSLPIWLGGMMLLYDIDSEPTLPGSPHARVLFQKNGYAPAEAEYINSEYEKANKDTRVQPDGWKQNMFTRAAGCQCGQQKVWPDAFVPGTCFQNIKCIGAGSKPIFNDEWKDPQTGLWETKGCQLPGEDATQEDIDSYLEKRKNLDNSDIPVSELSFKTAGTIHGDILINCDMQCKLFGVYMNPVWFDPSLNLRFQRVQNILFVNMNIDNTTYDINNIWITDDNKAYFKNLITSSPILQEDFEFEALQNKDNAQAQADIAKLKADDTDTADKEAAKVAGESTTSLEKTRIDELKAKIRIEENQVLDGKKVELE